MKLIEEGVIQMAGMIIGPALRLLFRGARPLSNAFKSAIGKEVKPLTQKQMRRLSKRDAYNAAGRRTFGQHAFDKAAGTAALGGLGFWGVNKGTDAIGKFLDDPLGSLTNNENGGPNKLGIAAGLTAMIGAFIKMPSLRPLIILGAVAVAGYALYKNAVKNQFNPAASETLAPSSELGVKTTTQPQGHLGQNKWQAAAEGQTPTTAISGVKITPAMIGQAVSPTLDNTQQEPLYTPENVGI